MASCNGHAAVVRLLLDQRVDVDLQDKNSCTALISAVRSNNIEIVRLLLDRGTAIDLQDKDSNTFHGSGF